MQMLLPMDIYLTEMEEFVVCNRLKRLTCRLVDTGGGGGGGGGGGNGIALLGFAAGGSVVLGDVGGVC